MKVFFVRCRPSFCSHPASSLPFPKFQIQLSVPASALSTSQQKRIRRLAAAEDRRQQPTESAVLQAWETRKPVLKDAFSMALPRSEDYRLVVALVIDPLTAQPCNFAVTLHNVCSSDKSSAAKLLPPPTVLSYSPQSAASPRDQLILALAQLYRSLPEDARVQCYVADGSTETALTRLIVEATSAAWPSADGELREAARLCFYAFISNAETLLAPIQPELLVGARRSGICTDAVLPVLGAVRQLLVLPRPGFNTLDSCIEDLGLRLEFSRETTAETVPTAAEVLAAGPPQVAATLCRQQLVGMTLILDGLRHLLARNKADALLLADAPPAVKQLPQPMKNRHLQRLMFICQYEALADCHDLRRERLSGTGTALTLSFDSYKSEGFRFTYVATSGADMLQPDSEFKLGKDGHKVAWALYKWLLTLEPADGSRVPPYLTFPDLSYYDKQCLSVKESGELQAVPVVITNVVHDTKSGQTLVETTKGPSGTPLEMIDKSKTIIYRLHPRFADCNLNKVLTVLKILDDTAVESGGLFVQLLENPNDWGRQPPAYSSAEMLEELQIIQGTYRAIAGLQPHVDKLQMNKAQKRIFDSICRHRLQLVWGPPGTGKTHFLALSVLYLLAAAYKQAARRGQPTPSLQVLITAFTHTAIDNLLDKMRDLLAIAQLVEGEALGEWRAQVQIEKLGSETRLRPTQPLVVFGATTWKVHKSYFDKKPAFDILVVDEASQLPVADAGIAVSCLKLEGRLIVCGDTLQLAPILRTDYPNAAGSMEPVLHRSLLECLLRDSQGRPLADLLQSRPEATPLLDMLNENFRMNGQLSDFTKCLYGPLYRAAAEKAVLHVDSERVQRLPLAAPLQTIFGHLQRGYPKALHTVLLKAPAVRNMSLLPYEAQVQMEAESVSALVVALWSVVTWDEKEESKRIFVITPHRLQKAAISQALGDLAHGKVRVDTVERMQGNEAEVAIICYGFFDVDRVARECDFLYNRNRINVAMTRARKLCILVGVCVGLRVTL